MDAAGNILIRKRRDQLITLRTSHDKQMINVTNVVVILRQDQTGIGKFLSVPVCHAASLLGPIFDVSHLGQQDTGLNGIETTIEAEQVVSIFLLL